jgi:hypothetical protein
VKDIGPLFMLINWPQPPLVVECLGAIDYSTLGALSEKGPRGPFSARCFTTRQNTFRKGPPGALFGSMFEDAVEFFEFI